MGFYYSRPDRAPESFLCAGKGRRRAAFRLKRKPDGASEDDLARGQRVDIEFEFESKNFRDHGHPAGGCDAIVCWRHNWPECPKDIEAVELSSVIKSLAKAED